MEKGERHTRNQYSGMSIGNLGLMSKDCERQSRWDWMNMGCGCSGVNGIGHLSFVSF